MSKVKVRGRGITNPFSATDATNRLESKSEVGRITDGAVRETADGNDTVPFSV